MAQRAERRQPSVPSVLGGRFEACYISVLAGGGSRIGLWNDIDGLHCQMDETPIFCQTRPIQSSGLPKRDAFARLAAWDFQA